MATLGLIEYADASVEVRLPLLPEVQPVVFNRFQGAAFGLRNKVVTEDERRHTNGTVKPESFRRPGTVEER